MCKQLHSRMRSGALVVLAATSVGACSADISRLDGSMLGVSDARTGSVRGTQNTSSNLGDASSDSGWGNSGPRNATRSGETRLAAAAPPDRRFTPPPYQPPYRSEASVDRNQRQATATPPYAGNSNRYAPVTAAPLPESSPVERTPSLERSAPSRSAIGGRSGKTITVQKGDTLYGLSRRHGVAVGELKAANGLTSSALKLGQQLVLPGAGGEAGRGTPATLSSSGSPRLEPRAVPRAETRSDIGGEPAQRSASGAGTYTVKRGDSLYTIARSNGITLAELQRVNDIADPRKVRPGTVLKLRDSGLGSTARTRVATVKTVSTTAASEPRPEYGRSDEQRIEPARTSPLAGSGQPRIINSTAAPVPGEPATSTPLAPSGTKVAGVGTAAVATMTGAGKFRWPANGRILSAFGPRPDGSHNDGINILVPLGTPVHAAEAGTVAYAGNELQGYGNLVLVRHDNGWVSAYAHNDKLMVKHGDRITRGQVIAQAGKSGSVDQPQIHFELREGAKPVDPRPHLAKL